MHARLTAGVERVLASPRLTTVVLASASVLAQACAWLLRRPKGWVLGRDGKESLDETRHMLEVLCNEDLANTVVTTYSIMSSAASLTELASADWTASRAWRGDARCSYGP